MKNRRPARTDEAKVDRDERDYLEQLLTEQEAAALLGLSCSKFLQNRRTRGGGPLSRRNLPSVRPLSTA